MSFGTFFRLLIVSGALILLTVYAKAFAATPQVTIESGHIAVISDESGRRTLIQD
jgi:hypothetical protein